MRLSALIAKCEDRVVANAPIVKAKAQAATHTTRSWLSTKLYKVASKVAPPISNPHGNDGFVD